MERDGNGVRPRREPDLTLLYEIARSRLDTQLAFLDSLDTKLGLFLSVGSAILTVAAALVAVDRTRWSIWAALALALAIGAFIGVAFFTVTALREQKWGIGPDITLVAALLKREGESAATKSVINTLIDLFSGNQSAYDAKVGALAPAAIALVVETLAAAAALALVAGR